MERSVLPEYLCTKSTCPRTLIRATLPTGGARVVKLAILVCSTGQGLHYLRAALGEVCPDEALDQSHAGSRWLRELIQGETKCGSVDDHHPKPRRDHPRATLGRCSKFRVTTKALALCLAACLSGECPKATDRLWSETIIVSDSPRAGCSRTVERTR